MSEQQLDMFPREVICKPMSEMTRREKTAYLVQELRARYIRQGERPDPRGQFEQPQPPFLSGLRTDYTYLGAQAKFEILHGLFARAHYQYMKTSKQQEDLSFIDDSNQEFYFAVYYGL